MFRPTLWRPSPQTTIDVTGGLSEVEKCSAAKSTTTSGGSGNDRGRSCTRLEVKRMAGLGLALDHSDTSHSRLRCIHSEQQLCTIDPYGRLAGLRYVYSNTFMYLLTFAGFAVRLQGESHGAAAAHPCGRVFTCPVAAAVVHGAGLCR